MSDKDEYRIQPGGPGVVIKGTGFSEADLAQAHLAAIRAAMGPLVTAMNAAEKDGFTVQFQMGVQFSRSYLQTLAVARFFT